MRASRRLSGQLPLHPESGQLVEGDVAVQTEREPTRILLARHRGSSAGRYSALAGFVEVGESLEDAVRREVAEETGVRVGISIVPALPVRHDRLPRTGAPRGAEPNIICLMTSSAG